MKFLSDTGLSHFWDKIKTYISNNTGKGDMLKNTYDTNENGIVDNAEKVNNHTVNSDVPENAIFTDTKDYNQFTNKPSVNNVILEGNKTLDDLGIQPKQIITNLSDIGITVSSSTVLSDIISAVPNNSVLNVYLNNEQAEFLYNNSDTFGNLPSDFAGVLTVQKLEAANITIQYETIYLYKDPTIYYTTCIGTEFRQWNVVSHGEKVLWSNPNSSGLVDATYVINLSSSDYDELRWIFTYSNTTDNQFSTNCLKGQNVMSVIIGYNNATLIRRIIDYVSPTQYKCRNARYGASDSAEHIIPIAVIGIKR